MRATLMYGAGEVRVETAPDPAIQEPTDAIVRILRAAICGSDLHPFHGMAATGQGRNMGHEFLGIVEDVGSAVTGLKHGDLVVASFLYQDNPCEFCAEGLQTSCPHGGRYGFNGVGGGQAEAIRVPLLAVLARAGRRDHPGPGRTWHRTGAVQPARPGLSHRAHRPGHSVRGRRHPRQPPTLHRRGPRSQPGAGRPSRPHRRRQGRHTGADRHRRVRSLMRIDADHHHRHGIVPNLGQNRGGHA